MAVDAGEVLRRVPPQAIENEEGILGGILIDNPALDAAVDAGLKAEHFYRESHRLIFRSMLALWDRGVALDAYTLTEHLRGVGVLEQVGGPAYLAELAARVPTAMNTAHYATNVVAQAQLRTLGSTATAIASDAYDGAPAHEVAAKLDAAAAAVLKLCDPAGKSAGLVKAGDVTGRVLDIIERAYHDPSGVTGIDTGFVDLNRITAGLQPGDLIIIAARPSMGKTALGSQIALNVALAGRPVGFFSLEMTKEQVIMRLLASDARIDLAKLRAGFCRADDFPKLARSAAAIGAAPLWIDDGSDITPIKLRTRARRKKQSSGLDLVIVDYLQLMPPNQRGDTREREIAEIARGLKALAKELKIPVIALAQLNRAVETREDRHPKLADLRESGAIEQEADLVGFIYRDDYYHKDSKEAGTAELAIAKQRNGPTDTVLLTWIASYCRFENYTAEGDYA